MLRRARSACRRTSSPGTGPSDVRLQHQLVPAADRGRASRSRASSASARTPTSARSRSSTGRPARAGCRSTRTTGGWEDAPFDPDAFTINIGDLMARWTGDRWRSGRHRVLPPPAGAPAEELMSLVYFYELRPRRAGHLAGAADRAARRPGAGGLRAVHQAAPGRHLGPRVATSSSSNAHARLDRPATVRGAQTDPCAPRPPGTRPTRTGSACAGWRPRWSAATRYRCTSRSAPSAGRPWPGGARPARALRAPPLRGSAPPELARPGVVTAPIARALRGPREPTGWCRWNLPAARLVLAASARGDDAGPKARRRGARRRRWPTAPRTPAAAVPAPTAADPERPWRRAGRCATGPPGRRPRATTVIGGAAPTPPAAPGDGVLLADPTTPPGWS